MIKKSLIYSILLLIPLILNNCFVKEKCYSNDDCPKDMICDKKNGECIYQCSKDEDCGINFECKNHKCTPKSNNIITCPPDMVNIENSFCMDRYEASRPDATENSAGKDNTYATSRKGVLPWQTKDNSEAERACKNAGKRLCTSEEWYFACAQEEGNNYSYGKKYNPSICNGIDTFCYCDNLECSGASVCPYPHCYNQKSDDGKGPCGSNFHIMPTGSFPGCVNKYGVYDLNGNVWEHTLNGSEFTVRGGAYNCGDSEKLHRCDYIPTTWKPSALGFRCCIGKEDLNDAGVLDTSNDISDVSIDTIITDNYTEETIVDDQGCIEEDIINYDTEGDNFLIDEISVDAEQSGGDISDTILDDALDTSSDTNNNIDLCPNDMVNINNQFCMDRYEASRPDATERSTGIDNSRATSRENVLPWYPVTLSIARDACHNANKRLCKPEEWYLACAQTKNYAYVYGNTYNATICNGIDAFCYCDNPQCSHLNICPYPHCYNQSSQEGGGPCGAAFRVMPTGYFKDCINEWGVFDINGNVWEIVDTDDGKNTLEVGHTIVEIQRCCTDVIMMPLGDPLQKGLDVVRIYQNEKDNLDNFIWTFPDKFSTLLCK